MEDCIRVVCRLRPCNEREKKLEGKPCVFVNGSSSLVVETKPQPNLFTFDYIGDENSTQQQMFDNVGRGIMDTCRNGYNGTIICYGQTGTGKSHTIFGSTDNINERGLVPRVLEYLFTSLGSAGSNAPANLTATCSFYEIYQERVYDLLQTENKNGESSLQVREDAKHGVFVDGITVEHVLSSQDASRILAFGYNNRHVGATTMNRESSRSHAVFLLTLEISEEQQNGAIRTTRRSRFSLVDLAGSERQKDTNATGDRLKEASLINKSLSALGNVINALSDKNASSAGGRPRHIHYRDSKLTFLLRDSLGGNSKTVLIATITAAQSCMAETLSTLKFAQRAKSIRNIVVLNEESSGSISALQSEISTLRAKLLEMENNPVLGSRTSSLSPGGGVTNYERLSFGRCSGFGNQLASSTLSPSNSNRRNESDSIFQIPHFFSGDISKNMVSQSLERCKASDELRLRTEIKNRALSQRLDQAEKNVLGIKMKLKMRDAEVQRYRKGTTDEASLSMEETIRIEVNAVREELQGEVLKYRLACEEWERRSRSPNQVSLSETPSTNSGSLPLPLHPSTLPTTANSVWCENREELFQHQILDRILDAEGSLDMIIKKIETMRTNKFEEIFGFTISEVHSFRSKCEEYSKELDSEQNKTKELNTNILKLQQKCDDLTMQNLFIKEEKLRASTEAMTQIEELTLKVDVIQRELRDKEDFAKDIANDLKRNEDEIRETNRMKETENREAYNKLMKDNMVLVRQCRDLDSLSGSKDLLIKEKDELIDSIQKDLIKFQSESKIEMDSLIHQLSEKELQVNQNFEKQFNLENRIHELTVFAETLEMNNVRLEEIARLAQEETSQLSRNVEKITFELDNAREDTENLYAQTETLLAERNQWINSLEESENVNAKQLVEIKAMNFKISEIQSLLDASSNDRNAECHKLMEALEKNNIMSDEIGLLSKQIDHEHKLLEDLQRNYNSLIVVDGDKSSTIHSMHQTIHTLQKEIVSITTQMEELNRCNDDKLLEIVELRHSNESLLEAIEKENHIDKRSIEQIEHLTSSLNQKEADLQSLNDSFEITKSKLQEVQFQKQSFELEFGKLQSTYQKLTEKNVQLIQQIADVQSENARLCGHQNAKQKIHQHMTLKKDIELQSNLVKQQQDQIVALTLERDTARNELKRMKAGIKDAVVNYSTSAMVMTMPDGSIAATVKAKRMPLKDTNSQQQQAIPDSMIL